jgi:hypothetical protein
LPDLLHTKSKKAGQLTGLSLWSSIPGDYPTGRRSRDVKNCSLQFFMVCRPMATTRQVVVMER